MGFALLLLSISFNLLPLLSPAEAASGLEITGDGVANPLSLTLSDLQEMEQYQHVYSTINTWPSKKLYVAQGVKLKDLLALAGLKENAQLIVFTSSDGYSVTLTVKELLKDKRYYFPYFQDNSVNDGTIPGSPRDAVEVQPILALLSAESSKNPADMNDMDALLLVCGQRAVSEQTNSIFLKYISKIEVLTSKPTKWDAPRANIGSGKVAEGTLIELSNKRNDTDKIYYTTDGSTPTINSPIFNWSASRWWSQRPDSLNEINKPIEIKKDTIIKAITIGPGKEDSDVVTFTYQPGLKDEDAPVKSASPSGLSLDEKLVNLKIGSVIELTAILDSDNNTEQGLIWSSSDTRVAAVDNHGWVTVVGQGMATITAKTKDGRFTATCMVNASAGVSSPSLPPQSSSSESQVGTQQNPEVLPAPQDDPLYQPEKERIAASVASSSDTPEPPTAATTDANWEYLAKKDNTAGLYTNNIAVQPQDPGGQIYELKVDTVALQLQMETKIWSIYILLVYLSLFIFGAINKYIEYTKEVAG